MPHLNTMREIINERQAQILAVLESRVDARHDDLRTLTGLKDQSYFRPMTDLRERKLVDETQAGSKHVLRFSMNDRGRKALIDYEARQHGTTKSAKINLMKQDDYKPKQTTFYRNNGNAHIPSLGGIRMKDTVVIRTVLVRGVPWPDPSAPPWIRPEGYYPQDFAVKHASRADEMLDWMEDKGWVIPMDAALAMAKTASVASKLMQKLEAKGKLESKWMRSKRGQRECKHYRVI